MTTNPIPNPQDILDAKEKDVRHVQVTSFALILLLLVVSAFWVHDLSSSREYWRGEAQSQREARQELTNEYTSLYDEYVEATGELPFAEQPSNIDDGTTGQKTEPSAAVQGEQGPPGPRGPRGEAGRSATVSQIRATLDAYCGEDACQGEPGRDGEDGAPGRDGVNGTSVSPDTVYAMIRDALAAYCAENNGCVGPRGPEGPQGATGPAGPKGDTGAPGRDGVGIASISCSANGEVVVTMTDGSTSNVGYCDPGTTDPVE